MGLSCVFGKRHEPKWEKSLVKREELEELHYITPIGNVASICRIGILSHRGAVKISHESVAMDEIQDRRAKVVVPGGRKLHDYVNLYLCARNPMLYKRQNRHAELCVLRISPKVLDLQSVVIADGNASSDYVRFAQAPAGLSIVSRELTFAEWWTDPDPIQRLRRKVWKCAEVLIPDRVDPEFLVGAYVSCKDSLLRFDGLGVNITAVVNPNLFFC